MTRLAVVLHVVAAAVGAAWWVLLLVRPELGAAFLPPDVPPRMIRTFLAADLAFYAVAPAVAAYGFARGRPWARGLLAAECGAWGYAALWGWGAWLVTGAGALGAVAMTPSAVVFPWLAWRLRRIDRG